ncbi:MAG: hypothetical protein K2J57_02115, partial [Bacteroidales bacterium]|nr:hypothetical protein [Bacteroidales bacterium]
MVTDASTLNAGDQVLIVGVGDDGTLVMTANFGGFGATGKFRNAVAVTIADNTITNPRIAAAPTEKYACVVTLEKDAEGKYAFYDNVSENYISTYSAGGLPASNTPCYFSIDITNEGVATIYDPAKQLYMRYVSKTFKAYGKQDDGSIIGRDVFLYKKPASVTPFINTNTTEVSYKIHPTNNLNENLYFTAGNLEDDINVDVASATGAESVITVNPTTILKEDAANFELALTTSNLPIGEYSDIITLTSGDVEVTVKVNLTVKEADIYQLVTNAAKLKSGDKVLIVGAGGYAMTATAATRTGSRTAVTVKIADNAIADPDIATAKSEQKACVFTIEKNAAGNYAFNDHLNDNPYLTSTTGNNSPSAAT